MSILGLIPARGGSKRLERKNLRPLLGHPLLIWTMAAAHFADSLDRIVVSSEDEEILDLTRAHDVEALKRPAELATDKADSYCVMLHALDALDQPFDYLCLLQPTSPLRIGEDIDLCIEALLGLKDAPAIVAVEQGKPVPNGSIYVGRTDWLRDGGNFDEPSLPRFEMPLERSVDVDTEEDLAWAERLARDQEFAA